MRRLGAIIVTTFCASFAVTPARALGDLQNCDAIANPGERMACLYAHIQHLEQTLLSLSTDLVDLRHELKEKLVRMGTIAETMIDEAIGELVQRNEGLAEEVPTCERDLNSMQIYDPTSDQWTFGPAMEVRRAGFGVTVLDGKIYVVGGEWINTLQTLNSVEVFDPSIGAWFALPDLPQKLHGVPLAGVDGMLYVMGGSTRSADVINPGNVFALRP